MFTAVRAVLLFTVVAASAANAQVTWEDAGCVFANGVMDCTDGRTGGTLTSVPTGIPSDVIHLWLSDNRISAISTTDLAGFSQLRYLYLDGNNIHSIAPGSFNDLVSLHSLLLDGNGLEDIPQGLFARCSKLGHVDLHGNGLTAVRGASFFGLVEIKYLNLYGNAITDVDCGGYNTVQTADYINTRGNPTVCTPDAGGHLNCLCSNNHYSTGSAGYCSSNTACSFLQPVFPIPTTTTTIESTTFAESEDQDFYVGTGDPVDINQNLEADASDSNESGGPSSGGLAAAITLCVVAVVALFGTIIARRHSAARVGKFSDTTSTIESGSSVGGSHHLNRQGTSGTNTTSQSDRIDLNWDDTATDTDWIEAPRQKRVENDDARSAVTESTVKSTILNKFMNVAANVWSNKNERPILTNDVAAKTMSHYSSSSTLTSLQAGTVVQEEAIIQVEADDNTDQHVVEVV